MRELKDLDGQRVEKKGTEGFGAFSLLIFYP